MGLIFANPVGLWMLLGIPVVLAIHFLRSRAHRLEVSTLFLLDYLPEEDRHGLVFQRIRSSLLLWFQILVVLLITWMLARPLFLKPDSVQTVAVVLDSSYSMRAFLDDLRRDLPPRLRRLEGVAATTRWFVVGSDPASPTIYSGERFDAMREAVASWMPDAGKHDPTDVLLRSRDLVGPDGAVVFVTDRIPERLPPSVLLLAIGRPIRNVGFGGVSLERDDDGQFRWRATLLNYGNDAEERSFVTEFDGNRSNSSESIRIDAGKMQILRGSFPVGIRRIRLLLEPRDSFDLDDVLHLEVPMRRPVSFANRLSDGSPERKWVDRVIVSVPDSANSDASGSALVWDFIGAGSNPEKESGIFLCRDSGSTSKLQGEVVAEDHDLTRDLNWHGLIANPAADVKLGSDDEVLLWFGEEPLIALCDDGNALRLVLRFDWASSNAPRLPAMVLLLHRFIERFRERLPGAESGIADLNQPLRFVAARGNGALRFVIEDAKGNALSESRIPEVASLGIRAPSEPGFFSVSRNGERLYSGGANFVDPRLSDFRDASSRDDLDGFVPERTMVHRREDRAVSFWLGLLALSILCSWHFSDTSRRRTTP